MYVLCMYVCMYVFMYVCRNICMYVYMLLLHTKEYWSVVQKISLVPRETAADALKKNRTQLLLLLLLLSSTRAYESQMRSLVYGGYIQILSTLCMQTHLFVITSHGNP